MLLCIDIVVLARSLRSDSERSTKRHQYGIVQSRGEIVSQGRAAQCCSLKGVLVVAYRLTLSEQVNSSQSNGEVSKSSSRDMAWFQECRLVPEWLLLREVKGEVKAEAKTSWWRYVRLLAVCDKGP